MKRERSVIGMPFRRSMRFLSLLMSMRCQRDSLDHFLLSWRLGDELTFPENLSLDERR